MSSSDIEYFRDRAAVEWATAAASTNPLAAAVHEELARGYEALVRREAMHSVPMSAMPEQDQLVASG